MSATPSAEPSVFIMNGDLATRRWVEATVGAAGLRALSFDTRALLLLHVKPGTLGCAILDVNLPDGSGFELQAELACAGIPTLFLTREQCISSCVRALRGGAVDYLVAPCNASSLIQVLRIALHDALTARTQRLQVCAIHSRYELLTARERQVFALVSKGFRNKQIAHQLNISLTTVQIHRGRVMKKMAARSIAALVRMADAWQRIDDTPEGGASVEVNSGKSAHPGVAARHSSALV